MSEGALWATARGWLRPFGKLERIENAIGMGLPDVTFALRSPSKRTGSGWIELKHRVDWPYRGHTPLYLPHFTKHQADWLRDWHGAGGRAYLLMQIERDYILLNAPDAVRVQERLLTKTMLVGCALAWGHRTFPTMQVLRCLTE